MISDDLPYLQRIGLYIVDVALKPTKTVNSLPHLQKISRTVVDVAPDHACEAGRPAGAYTTTPNQTIHVPGLIPVAAITKKSLKSCNRGRGILRSRRD